MRKDRKNIGWLTAIAFTLTLSCAPCVAQDEDASKNVLKQGLLGAGVGAISSSASGGNAGKGALIGAGTNVIGGALLDMLSGPSQPQPQQVQYVQAPQPVYAQPVAQQPVYAEAAPAYIVEEPVPQEDPNKKVLKQGLLGAGVGAISSSASGGDAGKGALIGAGTNVIGGALLDTLTGPSQPQTTRRVVYQPVAQPQPQYAQAPVQPAVNMPVSAPTQPKKKIIRKYDSDGKVVSEEEIWE